ncbi:hypothetical protein QQP08_010173 [Theobroma cacao]|nr:hypothetical protein QQP08_010173 [Theobroma cacao]
MREKELTSSRCADKLTDFENGEEEATISCERSHDLEYEETNEKRKISIVDILLGFTLQYVREPLTQIAGGFMFLGHSKVPF